MVSSKIRAEKQLEKNNEFLEVPIRKNPCLNVQCKGDEAALTKDVLSIKEIEQLIRTTYPQQNMDVRRAFIFCLYTGIRHCDVKDLRF